MTHLLYCIMKSPAEPRAADINGVGGAPVFLISGGGLSAALSELPLLPGAASSKELLDYSRVIKALHSYYGVIPVRYGCCFKEPLYIHDLLRQRAPHYLALLAELAGNVEMGIRILFPTEQNPRGEALQGSGLAAQKGSDYLAARKTYYKKIDQVSRRYTRAATHYAKVFSASCLRHAFEADEEKSLLSLYFLVPERQVEQFRETFRSIEKGVEERLLMSGPWPPYNFAAEAPLPL